MLFSKEFPIMRELLHEVRIEFLLQYQTHRKTTKPNTQVYLLFCYFTIME